MESEKELNQKILAITLKIKNEYPELSPFIEEMPVSIPDEKHPEISILTLKSYYSSLQVLLKKYESEHPKN